MIIKTRLNLNTPYNTIKKHYKDLIMLNNLSTDLILKIIRFDPVLRHSLLAVNKSINLVMIDYIPTELGFEKSIKPRIKKAVDQIKDSIREHGCNGMWFSVVTDVNCKQALIILYKLIL